MPDLMVTDEELTEQEQIATEAEPVEPDAEKLKAEYDVGFTAEPEQPEEVVEEAGEPEEPVGEAPMPSEGPDADLLMLAQQYGMPEEYARQFSSARDLERALMFSTSRTPEQQQQQPPQQTQAQAARDYRYEVAVPEGEEYDPLFGKMITGNRDWNKHTNSRFAENERVIERMARQIGEMGKALAGFQNVNEDREMEQFFGGLGDEYKAEIGEGPSSQLKRGSPQLRNRGSVKQARKDILDLYRMRRQAPPDSAELNRRALSQVFFDKQKTLAREEVNSKALKRKASVTHKPTGTKPGSGSAADFVRGWKRDRNLG